MSRLYGSMQGAKGATTRCGHNEITAHLRSWDLGVRVEVYHDKDTNKTHCMVYATRGSNGGGSKLIAEFDDYDKIATAEGLFNLISPIARGRAG